MKKYIANLVKKGPGLKNIFSRLDGIDDRLCEFAVENYYNKVDFLKYDINHIKKPRVHIIHILTTNNVGDSYCGPEFFLADELNGNKIILHDFLHVKYEEILSNDLVIIGGGGLLDFSDQWNTVINECLDKTKYVVLWGCGHNTHKGVKINVPIEYKKCYLIGIRDYDSEFYLPCVSCMLPYFDYCYSIKREIGIIEHKDYLIEEFNDFEKISNSCSLDTVMRFIGSSAKIVTNSYHAFYWSVLMGKRVVLYDSFSSKFDTMKYKIVRYSGNLELDFCKCELYPKELDNCRQLNKLFLNNIKKILDSIEKD